MLLGGCAGYSLEGENASPAPETAAAAGQEKPPPFAMAGRWMLGPGNLRSCVLMLDAIGGPSAGLVAASKTCPHDFSTARKWSYEDKGLLIRNAKGEVLGQLDAGQDRRFAGTANGGQPITLTR